MTGRWLLRVASNPRHGAGHVSRSRALSAALAAHGPVTLVVDAGATTWRERLNDEGFHAVSAGEEGSGPWLGAVLDGYDLPDNGIAELVSAARPLAVFDDFLSPPEAADLLINAAIGLEGDSINDIPALLGPAYACLDARYREPSTRPIEKVEHVVISFGMIDPDNATGLTLGGFAALSRDGIAPHLSVVIGSGAPHRAATEAAVEKMRGQASLLVDVQDMAALLRSADLVIGAGGVSLFERLALGLPSITFEIADNQRRFIEGAVKMGATVFGGVMGETNAKTVASMVHGLMKDRRARAGLRARGWALVDGRGADRVARHLVTWAAQWHGRTTHKRMKRA